MRKFFEHFWVGFLTGLTFMVIFFLLIMVWVVEDGYRQGQLDAERGVIRYELNERSERGWIRLNEAKE